jgi:hypothetical protein
MKNGGKNGANDANGAKGERDASMEAETEAEMEVGTK